jgi:hypothetical protein
MMQRASNATPIHCQRGDDSVIIATASPMLKCLFGLETASLHKRVGLVTREVIVDRGPCGSCRKRPGHKHTDDDRQDFFLAQVIHRMAQRIIAAFQRVGDMSFTLASGTMLDRCGITKSYRKQC